MRSSIFSAVSLAVLAGCGDTADPSSGPATAPSTPPAAQSRDDKLRQLDSSVRAAGQNAAKKLLAEALVAPASASYSWESVTAQPLEPIEGHAAWLVTGDVDSQNRLGAVIRGRWEALIIWTEDDDELVPLHVSLDGETVWGERRYRTQATPRASGPQIAESPEPAEEVAATESTPTQDAERQAASKLRLARQLLSARPERARERLQEIVDDFPGTEAAAEAAELLDD